MTTPIATALLEDLNRVYEMRYRPVGMELCIYLESCEKQKFQVKIWLNHINRRRSGRLTNDPADQENFVITLDTGEIIGRGFNGQGPKNTPNASWKLWEIEWMSDGRLKCRKCYNRWAPKNPDVPELCPKCNEKDGGPSSIEAI
jgi:hypothetical protein